jgi:hypothetical protein
MAIDLCNRLVDNELTKNELLEKVEITKTNPSDLGKICDTLSKAFGMESSDEALFQLINSRALLNESIKLVNKETGDIYGLLMFCEYPISFGSPIMIHEKGIGEYLNGFKQVNGHSFVIDERLRVVERKPSNTPDSPDKIPDAVLRAVIIFSRCIILLRLASNSSSSPSFKSTL